MRSTVIRDSDPSLEIWPGRRLLVHGELHQLPKGYMSMHTGASGSTLTFGTTTKATVMLSGPTRTIAALAEAIITMERPADGVVEIS